MVELRIVIPNHNQTLIFVSVVPFPQRGNYVLAVNSTKGPHIQQDDFAAQICQAKWYIRIEPYLVGQFWGLTQVGEGGGHAFDRVRIGLRSRNRAASCQWDYQ
jgi:hypothetical protein